MHLADLRFFAAAQPARYKLPTRLHLSGALSRDLTGKVRKHQRGTDLT